MSGDLPKRPDQHVSRDAAVRLAREALPRLWISREQDGDNDYGVDLEVELAGHTVSGQFFKAQIKGHERIPWTREGTYLQAVRTETLNYWDAMPVPVVLMVPELASSRVYWAMAVQQPGRGGVQIDRRRSLPSTAEMLELQVLEWLGQRGPRSILNDILSFLSRWDEIQEWTDYDCFLSLDDDKYGKVQGVYSAVFLLRQAVGLPYSNIHPFELWTARAQLTFGKEPRWSERLYYGQVDELVSYLRPLVDEAIEHAKVVLRAQDATPVNAIAKEWAERDDHYAARYVFENSLASAPRSFWDAVEADLEQNGALRWRVQVGKGK